MQFDQQVLHQRYEASIATTLRGEQEAIELMQQNIVMEKDEQARAALEQSMAHHQRMATQYVERHQDEARTEERNVVGQLRQALDHSERQFADRERAYQGAKGAHGNSS